MKAHSFALLTLGDTVVLGNGDVVVDTIERYERLPVWGEEESHTSLNSRDSR